MSPQLCLHNRKAALVLQSKALGNVFIKLHFNDSSNIHFSIKNGHKNKRIATPISSFLHSGSMALRNQSDVLFSKVFLCVISVSASIFMIDFFLCSTSLDMLQEYFSYSIIFYQLLCVPSSICFQIKFLLILAKNELLIYSCG